MTKTRIPQRAAAFAFSIPGDRYGERHFQRSEDAVHVVGRCACGRATVEALNPNNEIALAVRQNSVGAGWHPPKRH
jgi:hypothetical protein